ncbi:Sat10 [Stachybotrys chartarum IBT 7711]|uniref:Ankyrin repeat domain-containing protein SAT10 n=1 Tax=Stachybotrys chartarum (strain CBS 109288 / IBT 7711) TaxID=1280523 RepID=SAT10_STACB|nr:RecName: Full=Ankyrin repeat domain-containing protein SAT10; AltName: Full=Satratoxin biosynthesis SC1 cluster protein 10 [Stachybotrys chartarum IBT 7711]KEY74377.1 Sat10 [Stachybotrys chartarum IBT 7711]
MSIQFFSYDVGGLIVKEVRLLILWRRSALPNGRTLFARMTQALRIASSDKKYRSIFDRTSLLAFFATPHRSTQHQSPESVALALLNQCYCGLISPWISIFPPNFSKVVARSEVEFRPPTRAHILNVFQDPGPASPIKDSVVVHKSCAVLGVDGEVLIGLDCSHYTLARLLKARDKRYLLRQASHAALRHGKAFQQVVGLFFLDSIRTFDAEGPKFECRKVVSQLASLPQLQSWRQGSVDSRVLWFGTPAMLDPTSLFRTLRSQIQEENQLGDPIFIRVDSTLHRHNELSEPQILASMCQQILRQQPQLTSALQDLLLNVEDAAVGSRDCWKQRTLWNCLLVLLYHPKDAETFCFIDATSSLQTKNLAGQLESVMKESEMPLRLIVSCRSTAKQTPEASTQVDVDLSDAGFDEPLRQDLEEWIRESLECGLTDSTLREALLTQILSSGDFHLARHALEFFASTGSWLTKWSVPSVWAMLSKQSAAELFIEDNIRRHGQWLLIPMLWALEAFEPMQVDEIDVALMLEDNGVAGQVEDFINLLPGISTIRRGVFVIADHVRPAFDYLWGKYFATYQHHVYLAKSCVAALRHHLRVTPAIPQLREDKSSDAAARLCTYAAMNWVRHFSLQRNSETTKYVPHPTIITANETDPGSPNEHAGVSEAFLEDPELSRLWITHLRRALDLDGLDEELGHLILPETLGSRLGICTGWAIRISRQLASMRLSSERDVTNSLLVIGSETDDLAMVQSCLSADPSPTEHTLGYALAAASDPIKEKLLQQVGEPSDEFLYRALLSSICFGNVSVTEDLLVRITDKVRVAQVTPLEGSKLQWPQANESSESAETFRHTPLGVATAYGDADVIDLLINHDISWWDLEERSPPPGTWNALHHAALGGQRNIMCKLLLQQRKGVLNSSARIPNTVTESGNTPLILAASRGFHKIVALLLEDGSMRGYGVDVNIQNEQRSSALLAAARYGFSQTLEMLLTYEGIDYSKTDSNGASILHLALVNDREAAALQILAHKDIFSNEMEYQEANMEANSVNNFEDDDSFSESSVDTTDVVYTVPARPRISLHQKDGSGLTSLTIAIWRNLKSIVEILIAMDADANGPEGEFEAPLVAAAEVGSFELFTMFTKIGATKTEAALNTISTGRTRPLHAACAMGHLEVVRELLKDSVTQLSHTDSNQRTPLCAAISRDQNHVISVLLDRETETGLQEGLWEAARSGKAHILDQLLRRGAEINAQDEYGNTALQWASYYNKPRCVERLLLGGARLDLLDCDNVNALGDAARSGSAEPLKLLVDVGVDVNAEAGGDTALCRAIWAEEVECVSVLLQGGAKFILSSAQSRFENLLTFAVQVSSPEILRLLLKAPEERDLAPTLRSACAMQSTSQLEVLLEFYDPAKVDLGSGWTILHLAAVHGTLAGLTKVLDHATGRAALNYGPKKVGTPFEMAAFSSKESLSKVEHLYSNAALPGLVQPSSRFGTALNAASYRLNDPVVVYLLQKMQLEDINASGARYGNAIQNMLASAWMDTERSLKLLGILLEAGVSLTPTSADRHGTALHTAALFSPKPLVEKVIETSRMLADERDGEGRLPIHLSALQEEWASMMLLSTTTSTIRSVDKMGRNAVHLAAAAGARSVLEKIFEVEENEDLLLEADFDGWTPFHWACRGEDDDCARFLIEKARKIFDSKWDSMKHELVTTDEKTWTPLDVARFHQRREVELLLSLGMTTSDAENWMPDQSQNLGSYCDSCACQIWHEEHHSSALHCKKLYLRFNGWSRMCQLAPTAKRKYTPTLLGYKTCFKVADNLVKARLAKVLVPHSQGPLQRKGRGKGEGEEDEEGIATVENYPVSQSCGVEMIRAFVIDDRRIQPDATRNLNHEVSVGSEDQTQMSLGTGRLFVQSVDSPLEMVMDVAAIFLSSPKSAHKQDETTRAFATAK